MVSLFAPVEPHSHAGGFAAAERGAVMGAIEICHQNLYVRPKRLT
jgi:hypothetical protein